MKRVIFLALVVLTAVLTMSAQQSRTVQNRPYTDLRPFHFGILVGTHVQDLELLNVGPQTIQNEDGTETTRLITADQDRWDNGFSVGVLGEFRLSRLFQFRLAPAMYFGQRHLTFHEFSPSALPSGEGSAEGEEAESEVLTNERVQNLKTAYITCAADVIFGSVRNGNMRPYMMAGLNPVINLSGSESDILRLKRTDLYFEFGVGCDFYMPYFKLRPELKFMLGLTDCLNHHHAENLRDVNLRVFSNSVSRATSRMIALTFYFE